MAMSARERSQEFFGDQPKALIIALEEQFLEAEQVSREEGVEVGLEMAAVEIACMLDKEPDLVSTISRFVAHIRALKTTPA